MTQPRAVDTNVFVDTNVLVAALVLEHEHHDLALDAAADATHVLGQVAVEAWSVLRGHFRLPATLVGAMVSGYREPRSPLAPSVEAYERTLVRAPGDGLSGDFHDAVIVQTAAEADLQLVTLDAGLHRLASGLVTCELLASRRPS